MRRASEKRVLLGQPQPWQSANGNLLLASLSEDDRQLLAPHLEIVDLEAHQALYDPDVPIEHVWFPHAGLVSMLAVLTDSTGVETAIVGREGMVGMPVFHGTDRIAEQAVVQISGRAARMPADDFRRCIAESEGLRRALHHYAASVFMFTAQSVACMGKHDVPRRLARWLLHAADHAGTVELPLTHLFVAHMLGVRRSSVTVAASDLRNRGLITYTRKSMRITDRDGLAAFCCECYRIVRSTYDRLIFGATTPNPLDSVEASRDGVSVLGAVHDTKRDTPPPGTTRQVLD
jgi:CRP-like cAMP-binding protein